MSWRYRADRTRPQWKCDVLQVPLSVAIDEGNRGAFKAWRQEVIDSGEDVELYAAELGITREQAHRR